MAGLFNELMLLKPNAHPQSYLKANAIWLTTPLLPPSYTTGMSSTF